MSSQDKIRFILTEVKRGNVLVLEQGLTATEEAELIKTTMSNIDQDTFIGIEMQSYSAEDVRKGSWLSKLLKRKQPPRMSVIGPADLLRTVHKDGNMIQTMVLTRSSIVEEGEGSQAARVRPPPPLTHPQEPPKKDQTAPEPEQNVDKKAPPQEAKETKTDERTEEHKKEE